jgi:hypothetical protein
MPGGRIAFLILAHNDPTHLVRLCRSLHPAPVFVHIDAKAINYPVEKIAALPGVTVVSPSTEVYWADFSMIEAILTLLRTARSHGPFDRYVFLSGSCYPIRPLASIISLFDSNPAKEWIGLTPITAQSHLYTLIARHWRMAPIVKQPTLDRALRLVRNKISKWRGRNFEREIGMTPYHGSSWWALTGACVDMILDVIEKKPLLVSAYRSVYSSDEQLLHTIVGNSRFSAYAVPMEDRGPESYRFAPLHKISDAEDKYYGSTEADFHQFSASNALFIRKVSTERSSLLLDRIDRELLGTPAQGAV